jgi:hypothetical protein
MSNKQQTAVEWLFDQMFDPTYPAGEQVEWLEQAKEMEKEQIKEAFKHGELPPLFINFDSEQYYNETYGGN